MEVLMNVYLVISAGSFLFGCFWQMHDNRDLPMKYHQPVLLSGALLGAGWPLLALLFVIAAATRK